LDRESAFLSTLAFNPGRLYVCDLAYEHLIPVNFSRASELFSIAVSFRDDI